MTISAGGTDIQVVIDPSAYASGDPADLAARISAAYHEAFRSMSDRAAQHGAALQAYGDDLLNFQGRDADQY